MDLPRREDAVVGVFCRQLEEVGAAGGQAADRRGDFGVGVDRKRLVAGRGVVEVLGAESPFEFAAHDFGSAMGGVGVDVPVQSRARGGDIGGASVMTSGIVSGATGAKMSTARFGNRRSSRTPYGWLR